MVGKLALALSVVALVVGLYAVARPQSGAAAHDCGVFVSTPGYGNTVTCTGTGTPPAKYGSCAPNPGASSDRITAWMCRMRP
jgi:hypothetical protein